MYRAYIALAVVVGILIMIVKLAKSKKFDIWCKSLINGDLVDDTTPTTKDTMKNISKEEKDLSSTADKSIKEADKLKQNSTDINDFLNKRGVDSEKKEDS